MQDFSHDPALVAILDGADGERRIRVTTRD
jgi:hypothetical protein